MLGTGRLPKAPISEEKVPGGVEGSAGVGADMPRVVVMPQGGGRSVARSLRGEGSLAGGEVVAAGVNLEGAHSVGERVDAQTHFSIRHVACGVVVPGRAEGGDSYGRVLGSCVQQHRFFFKHKTVSAKEEIDRDRCCFTSMRSQRLEPCVQQTVRRADGAWECRAGAEISSFSSFIIILFFFLFFCALCDQITHNIVFCGLSSWGETFTSSAGR